VEGSTWFVKSVTLQCDSESDSVNSTSLTGMVKSVFLLLDGARILSVSEPSGDSVNSAMPDVKSLMVNSQCSVHLVRLIMA